ncbi:MAG: flagellar hook-basal body complex protein [Planctomycetota bacterium]
MTFDFFLALTPAERWKGRPFNDSVLDGRWLIVLAVVVLVVLTLLLVAVNRQKRTQQREVTSRLFFEYADKRGLSARECRVLIEIAKRAGIKRSEDVFTDDVAFYRGAVKLMEDGVAHDATGGRNDSLSAELFFLREKLGFQNQVALSSDSSAKSKKRSSRQIPAGRKVHITRRIAHESDDIEAIVMENNKKEFTIKSAMPVKVTFGEPWRVRYHFNSSIWEFDTTVTGCNGDILALKHNDNVRFINRRRFHRVPVSKPAFVARFPFSKMLFKGGDGSAKRSKSRKASSGAAGKSLGLPDFVPAVVTELAGPGLRIEAPLEVNPGDRVLVVLKLGEDKADDVTASPSSGNGKTPTSRVVEDIGEVRHVKAVDNGFSIAVELIGLGDSDVGELIQATNVASRKAGAGSREIQITASVDALMEEFYVITHNLANVSTVGYKRRCNAFTRALEAQGVPTDNYSPGTIDLNSVFDFSQGSVAQTGRPLDLALNGQGFFVVETPQGPLYTRNGAFQTNHNGQIVDSQGRIVAGQAGPITIPLNAALSEVAVTSDGSVSVDGVTAGRFTLVDFPDNVVVTQGYQEASNVKIVDELVDMIMVSRLYESNMKIIAAQKEASSSIMGVAMG